MGQQWVAVTHFGRDELRARDRHFSRATYKPRGSFGDAEGISDSGNTIILLGDDGGRFALGDCDTSTYTGVLTHPAGEVCGFPSGDVYWLRDEMSRESVQLTADQMLDDHSKVYAEARIAQGENFQVSTPNSDRLTIQPTGDIRQMLLDAVDNLPTGYVFPDDPSDETDGVVSLLHSFVGHGNREWTTNLEEYEFTFGVEVEPVNGPGYDVHVEYYKHRETETGINLQSVSLVRAAILSGAYDVVNPLSQTPEHLQAIHDTAIRSSVVTENEFVRANASVEGEAFAMPGGAVRWTVGAEV